MGSLKISSDPSGVIMSPFKATLWLSVLTVSTVVNHVGAAPVELVAGRVVSHEPLTQNLGFVGDINSLRSLFANGIPAGISLVRTVPQVSHVNHVSHAVPTVNAVSTVPVAKTILQLHMWQLFQPLKVSELPTLIWFTLPWPPPWQLPWPLQLSFLPELQSQYQLLPLQFCQPELQCCQLLLLLLSQPLPRDLSLKRSLCQQTTTLDTLCLMLCQEIPKPDRRHVKEIL